VKAKFQQETSLLFLSKGHNSGTITGILTKFELDLNNVDKHFLQYFDRNIQVRFNVSWFSFISVRVPGYSPVYFSWKRDICLLFLRYLYVISHGKHYIFF
jgi:hypothetical protein